MTVYNKENLDQHYDINIYEKNKQSLLSGGIGDEFLKNAKNDNRMSIALLIRIPSSISNEIEKCINNLKEIEPDLYYYPKSDFHITVMDILKGHPNRSIPSNIDDYKDCIEKCVSEIKPFKIEFNGLTASNNAIMVKGYYGNDLQKLRELLRKSFKERGLLLEERYETISCHITIMRIPNKITKPKQLMNIIESKQIFGTMEVNEIELSYHNWYDSKKEALSIIKLK